MSALVCCERKSSRNSSDSPSLMSASTSAMRSSMLLPSASTSCSNSALRRSSSSLKAAIRSNRPASSISSPVSSSGSEHRVGARPRRRADLGLLVQHAGGVLVALQLEQPPHERLARVLLLLLACGLGRRDRHQQLRLDVDQGRRHDHELAGELEVQLAHQLQVLHVLARDGCDRDVVDVELVAPDQVQQQVQRAFEARQQDARRVRRQRRLDVGRHRDGLLRLARRRGGGRLGQGLGHVVLVVGLVVHARSRTPGISGT